MREILFRGKDVKENWHIGLLAKSGNGWYISNSAGIPLAYEVIPSTVGQFTSLTDMNGKKIFEGDILRYYDDEIQIVEWNREFSNLMLHTYCKYERKKGRKVVIENSDGWNWLHDYPLNKMSIIGNIHDNPELLKGANSK